MVELPTQRVWQEAEEEKLKAKREGSRNTVKDRVVRKPLRQNSQDRAELDLDPWGGFKMDRSRLSSWLRCDPRSEENWELPSYRGLTSLKSKLQEGKSDGVHRCLCHRAHKNKSKSEE